MPDLEPSSSSSKSASKGNPRPDGQLDTLSRLDWLENEPELPDLDDLDDDSDDLEWVKDPGSPRVDRSRSRTRSHSHSRTRSRSRSRTHTRTRIRTRPLPTIAKTDAATSPPPTRPKPKPKQVDLYTYTDNPDQESSPPLLSLVEGYKDVGCPCDCHADDECGEGRPWVPFGNAAYVVCPMCWVDAYVHARDRDSLSGYQCEPFLRERGLDPLVAASKQC